MSRCSCKGNCIGLKHDIQNRKRYENGDKYCPRCLIWVKTEFIRCECCNEILRTRARNTRNKQNDRWLKAY